ncbi:DUF1257 domain-containing protein [Paenibacillus motobuensis]|uniref:DUF1257 domain-containing protein n=1 Tax=Paenibacillus TaxID=44249 RepID=UPI002040005B|nr:MULTISPECIES: DUF1257 domain-containing protein [Paenibacillus]MCM3040891.1 DUF1257 domain-containing protein [Paenibacillus lutimineralis]MCM3647995.1 DUF1257 domain-containing protein [Paenibacillus motobuensis]
MSVEIVLIPVAIALTKEIAEGISRRLENKDNILILETRMKDELLLKQALEDWNCSFRSIDHSKEIAFPLQGNDEVIFMLNSTGRYSLVLPQTADQTAYEEWLSNVEDSYTHLLQQQVYQNLIERAPENGLILEQEERLADRSIQLTYILDK